MHAVIVITRVSVGALVVCRAFGVDATGHGDEQAFAAVRIAGIGCAAVAVGAKIGCHRANAALAIIGRAKVAVLTVAVDLARRYAAYHPDMQTFSALADVFGAHVLVVTTGIADATANTVGNLSENTTVRRGIAHVLRAGVVVVALDHVHHRLAAAGIGLGFVRASAAAVCLFGANVIAALDAVLALLVRRATI